MGLLRLFLAMIVFDWHYFQVALGVGPNSFSAVYIFFIISGFYMSLVLNEKYRNATAHFYLNRALRLYPTYWAALLLCSIAAVLGVDGAPNLFFPHDTPINASRLWALTNQLLIFPEIAWSQIVGKIINPLTLGQIYTVALEMMFYAVAPLIVRRSLPVLLGFTVACDIVHYLPHYFGLDPRPWQYEFFPATLVLFMLGAIAYRLYLLIADMKSLPRGVGFLTLPMLVAYSWHAGNGDFTNSLSTAGLYLIAAAGIPFLFIASKNSRLDRFLGDLSYPLYVIHPLAVLIGQDSPWGGTKAEPWIVLAIAFALTIALVFLVERPIETLRRIIARPNGNHWRIKRRSAVLDDAIDRSEVGRQSAVAG